MNQNHPKRGYMFGTRGGTVVDDMIGLLLSTVIWYSKHLHFDQRVHDGGLLLVHFGELLCRDDLVTGGRCIRNAAPEQNLKVLARYSTMRWKVLC